MNRYVLVTGATGLVGQYLLRDLLSQEIPVAVLVRSQGDLSARLRIEGVLAQWEKQQGRYLPRPVCLEGDLTVEGLGLEDEVRHWIARHCDRVLHNAASLTFDGADRGGEPWLSNLTGTEHVLELCRETGIRQLHYMSTAYVCGKRSGPVLESELDCGQPFRNDYEQSKFEAEQAVRSASFLDSLTVYRPAIIVGDSQTGYTSSYHALYLYLQLIHMLDRFLDSPRDENGYRHVSLRLNLTGQEWRNLVPVDWISAVTCYLFATKACHGETYHLTPPKPITVRTIEEACEAYFRFRGVTFEGPGRPREQERTDLEKLFYEQLTTYAAYWESEPMFDCTNTCRRAPHLPCPEIDTHVLHRLIDFAIEDRWGNRRKQPPRVPFDVAAALENRAAISPRSGGHNRRSREVGLDLWGPGGGQWHVRASRRALSQPMPGLVDGCDIVFRTNVDTFAAIVGGELAARQALRHAQVEVLTNGSAPAKPAALLELFATSPKKVDAPPARRKEASRQTA